MSACAAETKEKYFRIKNVAGFALVYVMALSALVSVMISMSLHYFSVNAKSRDNVLKKSKMSSLIHNLRNQLNDGTICPAILGNGINTITIAANAVTPVQLQYAMAGGSGSTITTGWKFEDSLTIKRVELRVLSPALSLKNGTVVKRGNAFGAAIPYFPVRLSQSTLWPLPWTIAANSLTLDKYYAELRIVPDNYVFNYTDEKNVIRLYVKVTPAGQIIQCHGEVSEAESCEARGMSYDGIYAPVQFRCNPDFYCRKDIQLFSAAPVCTAPFTSQLLSYEASTGNRMVLCAWCNP